MLLRQFFQLTRIKSTRNMIIDDIFGLIVKDKKDYNKTF